jgi:hypothetical protein
LFPFSSNVRPSRVAAILIRPSVQMAVCARDAGEDGGEAGLAAAN